jgi:selenocysteine lyase/cysteine desulfurase
MAPIYRVPSPLSHARNAAARARYRGVGGPGRGFSLTWLPVSLEPKSPLPSPSPGEPEARGSADRWRSLRARFPILSRKVYLNSCSCGALAESAAEALARYTRTRCERGSDWEAWMAEHEALRGRLAALLAADVDEVAVTASASAALNAIASALAFGGGRNRIVITDLEFPTHAQIWHAQAARGAEIVQIRSDDGGMTAARVAAEVDGRTLLIATSSVCYRNGARLPIGALAEIAHRNGALLLVDDYQGLGTMRESAKEQGADFVVGGMVKYLLGTSGIGFAYVAATLIEQLVPTATGWLAQADVAAMDVTANRPASTARRFEAGTPSVPSVQVACAGLAIVEEAGLAAIEERIRSLTQAIKSRARDAGYRLAAPEPHGAMIALRAVDAPALVAALAREDIVTSCRDGNLRVATHFYNDDDDVMALFEGLRRHEHLLARTG